MSEKVESYDQVVSRHALEDAAEREHARRTEKLVGGLHVGYNYFEPQEFHDLACYFLEGRGRTDALDDGFFVVMGKVNVLRALNNSLMTISDIARSLDIPQQTLWRWVSRLDLPYREIGKRKYYNINEIRRILLTRRDGERKGLR